MKDDTLTYADLSKDEKQLLERVNQYDLELYDYGCQLFQNRLDERNIDFERELRTFGRYNRIYYFKTATQNKLRSVFRSRD